MDVKGCSYCPTRYSATHFDNAKKCHVVLVRQKEVDKEAVRKAKRIDTLYNYNGWSNQSTVAGPRTQRLAGFDRILGLVVGAHGEGSPDMLGLIQRLACREATTRFRVMGFDSSRSAKSTVLNQIYLSIGVEAIRGMARLRIDNLGAILADTTSSKAVTARRNKA